MPRRRQEDTSNEVFDNVIESLTKGTGFKLSSKSEVLNQRKKVRTPIEALNCILGGGIPFGTIVQSYGPPRAGKSTWMYQMMGNFQKEYPNGVAVIIDTESSADGGRLEYLGVNTSKVLRLPSTSIESGFLALLKLLENKSTNPELKDVPVFVIWDTISKGLAQDGSTQSRMNAQDRARIIKNYMSPVMAQIEKQDFILGLLNQVIYTTDSYGNRKMDSGGGIALKHDVHLSTRMNVSGDGDRSNGFLLSRTSIVDIDKSKLGPEISGIPVIIDVKEGGLIDEVRSFTDYMARLGFFVNSSGWYRYDDLMNKYKLNPFYKILEWNNKSYRYNDIQDLMKNDKLMYLTMRYLFMTYIAEMYKLQSKVMEDYYNSVIKELRELFDPAELYMSDNETKINEYLEFLKTNDELLAKIKNNLPNCDAICLKCGEPKDRLSDCSSCSSDMVVSKKVAEQLISRLEINVDTAEEVKVEDAASDSEEVSEVVADAE